MYTLIDGDVLVYSCGFASEKNVYTVAEEMPFQYKKDAKAYAKKRGFTDEDIVKTIIPGSVSHALQNVKQTLISIAEACDSHDGQIYLTGEGNFRHDVAVSHVYKGTRDVNHKPIHYQAIIDYLVQRWDAEVVQGMEADDAMGIAQCDRIYGGYADFGGDTSVEESIICTIDKDLDMIPGWHYNFRNGTKYSTTLEESDYFFHKQMLTGDRVDNIVGIYGIGDKKADKALKGKTYGEREHTIRTMYAKEFGKLATARYDENKQLLWILRELLND